MRFLVACSIILVALAGCADASEPEQEDEFDNFEPVEVDDDKGVIRGVVVDGALNPIPEATIAIRNLELETTSNEEGLFQFVDLDGGAYFLDVTKPGYAPIQTSTTVEPGVAKPPIVRVQIDIVPGLIPTAQTVFYEAFISCGFKTGFIVWDAYYCDPTGALGMAGRDDSEVTFDAGREDAPSHFQSEILWNANQPLSSGLVTIQCNRDNAACGSGTGSDRICNIRGESPLICRVNNNIASADIGGGGNNFTTLRDGAGWTPTYTIGLFSNCAVQCVSGSLGVGLAVDQEVSFYVTLFYNHIPEEDWAFITDGEYEF